MENFSALALSLENLNKFFTKIKDRKISEYGMRGVHFNCMMHIDLSPEGLTSTEISRDCGVDKAFVSRTTQDLIKFGFIKKNDKFNDGRKYRNKYILTDKGREIIRDIKESIEKYLDELCMRVSEQEMKCFFKVIFTLSDTFTRKACEG